MGTRSEAKRFHRLNYGVLPNSFCEANEKIAAVSVRKRQKIQRTLSVTPNMQYKVHKVVLSIFNPFTLKTRASKYQAFMVRFNYCLIYMLICINNKLITSLLSFNSFLLCNVFFYRMKHTQKCQSYNARVL